MPENAQKVNLQKFCRKDRIRTQRVPIKIAANFRGTLGSRNCVQN